MARVEHLSKVNKLTQEVILQMASFLLGERSSALPADVEQPVPPTDNGNVPADTALPVPAAGQHSSDSATTEPATRTIFLNENLTPPLLDRVLLHEVAHATTVSWNLLEQMRTATPRDSWVPVEEWAAQLVEGHSIEAIAAASRVLGRPVCVLGTCMGKN